MRKHIKRDIEALGVLLAIIAAIHLSFVFILAIFHHDLHFINPLYFFGLSEVTSKYVHSDVAVGIGWIFLVLFFMTSLYILRNKKIVFLDKDAVQIKKEDLNLNRQVRRKR